ncbi:MAG TPA: VC1465 family Xer recombination activation factor [Alicycliphilus sp.]|nr:VC1465 family Xer recombination activation factor [Alicycliphilus sp.]
MTYNHKRYSQYLLLRIYIVSSSLGLRLRRNDRDTRLQQAQKFRAMYRNLGLDLPGCAKLLHVTERTLRNWESGKHDIPHATFKLLRLLNGMELPGDSWRGWSFHGGKLWSPEGRSFVGADGSWWSLLVRQARFFGKLQARNAQLENQLAAATAGQGSAARDGAAASSKAANQPNFQTSPMVITGRPFCVIPRCEIPSRGHRG